jgi:hypothetical protein
MPKLEIYSRLSAEDAIDVEGRNISHPLLRERHLRMVPFLRVITVDHFMLKNPYDQDSDQMIFGRGQAVAHRDLVDTFNQFFEGLRDLRFPLERAIPISQSPDSQDAFSMAHNRTLIYRPDVIGDPDDPAAPRSIHSYGAAVDINPLHNPIVNPDHTVEPVEAVGFTPHLSMMLLRNLDVADMAADLDMEWGNDWPDPRHTLSYAGIGRDGKPRHILRDTHHFELLKPVIDSLELPHAA